MRKNAAAFAALLLMAPPLQAAHAGEVEFLALQSSTPGAFNYARVSEIQVFLDESATRCGVFMTTGQEIKAFQTCASITAHLEQHGLVTLPSNFGTVLLAPDFVLSLVSIPNGGCRLNLRNGVWVPVKEACAEALKTMLHE
jgi:hypothetical protein